MDKSKRMAVTELEIKQLHKKKGNLEVACQRVSGYVPVTPEGKKLHEEALTKIESDIQDVIGMLAPLRTRLEIETIEFLSGEDTEVYEPTTSGGFEIGN